MKEKRFLCDFCGTRFSLETRYMNHRCKQMIRQEEFITPIGQAAWIFYQKWMKAKRKVVPKSSTFLHSKFYNSFIRFAEYIKKSHLPDVDMFIWLMTDKDISPTIWTSDQVYSQYIEFMDRKATPTKQAEITINSLFDLAQQHNCDVTAVFDTVCANEIIQLIRQRRLSPWLLLNSSKFREFFVKKTSAEERIILENIIRPPYWTKKFLSSPKDIQRMKLYVSELSL